MKEKGQLRRADELRKEATFGVLEADARELAYVATRIEEAHQDGRWFVTFDSLKPSTESKLQAHGYGIQHVPMQNGCVRFIVSWK